MKAYHRLFIGRNAAWGWKWSLIPNESWCACISALSSCLSSQIHTHIHTRPRSPLAWTSELPTRLVTAASYADVSAKTVLCSQRPGSQARTVQCRPPRLPVPSSCPFGCALTAGAQWRRRTAMLPWSSRWGWVTWKKLWGSDGHGSCGPCNFLKGYIIKIECLKRFWEMERPWKCLNLL